MRTNFTPQQLAAPEFVESEQILRRCVHCGFCTATCPTYLLLGDELDSPRGRIVLIKEMLESDCTPAPQTVKHIDRCLSCLSCVTTCPSGVDYMHLIDHARDFVERRFKRPLLDRLLRRTLGALLSRPAWFRAALMAARVARPLAPLMPAKLQALFKVAQSVATPLGSAARPQVFAPIGARRGRVALLSGCAQPVLAPSINEAAVRLLTRHGIEVVIAERAGCCGSIEHHLGRADRSRALARLNVHAWQRELDSGGLDAIITTTSGCGTMLKDYGHLLRDDAQHGPAAAMVSSLAKDICEFVASLELAHTAGLPPLRVAYQSPCSMHHGQKISDLPRRLLTAAGFVTQPLDEAHICCGSAGTYNLLQPEIATQLRIRKQAIIATAQPDVVATGNIGCMTQLAQDLPIPIVHTIELLDWASGGPRPAKLRALP